MQTLSREAQLIFEANRAIGEITFSAEATGQATRRCVVHERGPLRVRFPNADPRVLEAVIVNTAGGIAGGDSLAIDVSAGDGAQLAVSTAAAEKIYRSMGSDAKLTLKLRAGAGAHLSWLPQETIMFDRARLSRRIDVDLAPKASLVLAEAFVFGRSAMGEAVEEGAVTDCWRVRRGGKLIFAETARLTGAISRKLSEPAVAKGAQAIATLLVTPAHDGCITEIRALAQDFASETAISAWNGIAMVRFCAPDGAALRHDLLSVLATLRISLPRLWLQ